MNFGQMSTEELRALRGSLPALELERRAREQASASRIGTRAVSRDAMADGRKIMLAHQVGSRDLENALASRSRPVDPVTIDQALFAETAGRVGHAHNRLIARAFAAATERPRVSSRGPLQSGADPWGQLVRRAHGAVVSNARADHGPTSDGIDPDTVAAENSMLSTPGAVVVSRAGDRR